MKLIIIRGPAGFGKSTYAKKHYQCMHIETDMLCMVDGKYQWDAKLSKHRHQQARELVEKVLAIGSDVVVCNTFTQIWELQPYLDLATKYGATVEVIRMTTEYGSIHNVPTEIINKMRNRFEDYQGEMYTCTELVDIPTEGRYEC